MKNIILITIVCLLKLHSFSLLAASQRYGIHMDYSTDYSLYHNDGVISNTIMIYNNTNKERRFTWNVHTPRDWRALGKNSRSFFLAAGDSTCIPVRVHPITDIDGGLTFTIKATLFSEGMQVSACNWILENDELHDWEASIIQNEKYFMHDENQSFVQVHFTNGGNVDEELELSYLPSHDLEIVGGNVDFLHLKRGQDTTIKVDVRIISNDDEAVELYKEKRSYVKHNLKVKALAKGKSILAWQRSASFVKTRNTHQENKMKHDHLPLTIDFQTYDILSENVYASLSLSGTKVIDENRFLTYNVQLYGAANSGDGISSNYQNVSYYSKTFTAQIGNVSNNLLNAIVMNGKGISAMKYFGEQHTLASIYTRGPHLFKENYIQNVGVSYGYKTLDKRLRTHVYVQNQTNKLYDLSKSVAGFDASYSFFKSHSITGRSNFSFDEDKNVNNGEKLFGYDMRAVYSGRFGKSMNTSLRYHYSSPDYISSPGTNDFSASTNFRLTQYQGLSAQFSKRSYAPNIWDGDVLVGQEVFRKQQEVKMVYNHRNSQHVWNISPQYVQYQVPDINHIWYGVGFNYLFNISTTSYFNLSALFQENDFSQLPDETYRTMQFNLAFRKRRLRLSGIYNLGARYLNEHKMYAETREVPRSYYLNANYQCNINPRTFLYLTSSFNYRSAQERVQLNFRPNLEYIVSNGFKLKGYASIMGFHQKYAGFPSEDDIYDDDLPSITQGGFEMGVGFVKDIGIPFSKKKNFDVKFVAFVDNNGNGSKDVDEATISNMLLIARRLQDDGSQDFSTFTPSLEIMTNAEGEAALLNIQQGSYRVEMYPLEKVEGWLTESTISLTVLDDQTVLLPQSKGGRISGRITLEVDDYSRFHSDISLENIKVIAKDSLGMEFSCLTDKDGFYMLSAPSGEYIISVNEDLFSGSLELTDNHLPVKLENRFVNAQQNFFAKEKKRKIVVKKFGANADDTSADTGQDSTDTTEEDLGVDSESVSDDATDTPNLPLSEGDDVNEMPTEENAEVTPDSTSENELPSEEKETKKTKRRWRKKNE